MYIGIDLGGTNIAVGAVDGSGKILAQDSRPTDSGRGFSEIVRDMAELSEIVADKAGFSKNDIEGIGIGSPGTIDSRAGVIVYANNLHISDAPIIKEMQTYFPNTQIAVENDANAAALGEYSVSGENADSFIAITLGTGVGGGIVLNGKIYRGFNGAGGEMGHFTLMHGGEECTCGKRGCWESYASVTALIRQTKDAIAKNPDSLMSKIVLEEGKVSGRTAFEAAKQGDKAAEAVVRQYALYVADGISSIINIFQPDKLVVGGGISREGEYLLAPVREYIQKYDYNKYLARTEISAATLFNDAGIIGAALAAKSQNNC